MTTWVVTLDVPELTEIDIEAETVSVDPECGHLLMKTKYGSEVARAARWLMYLRRETE